MYVKPERKIEDEDEQDDEDESKTVFQTRSRKIEVKNIREQTVFRRFYFSPAVSDRKISSS
jgi:hypothetical protein